MSPRLNQVELLALLAVARLGADANARTVRADIRRAAERTVSVPAVYAALDRLARARLVHIWLSDPRPTPGGRARQHFELTAAGRDWLEREHARTLALWRDALRPGRRPR